MSCVMDIFYKEIINHGRLRDLGNSGMMWCGYAMELGRMLRSKLERRSQPLPDRPLPEAAAYGKR